MASSPEGRSKPLQGHALPASATGQLCGPALVTSILEDTHPGLPDQSSTKPFDETQLAKGYGWCVRTAAPDDLRAVASLQSEVFYEPSAIPALDGFFFSLFKAELLDNLLRKVRNYPPRRHACLVALLDGQVELRPPPGAPSEGPILGTVDLTAVADSGALCHMEGAEEFLYISGMAVASTHRRLRGATVLLEAAEALAAGWGFKFVALHVHEDNEGARCLYQRAGYVDVASDAIWATTWLGRRRRVLMAKRMAGAGSGDAAPVRHLVGDPVPPAVPGGRKWGPRSI